MNAPKDASVTHADRDVARLAIAALGENGWMPIESAPKDGKSILVHDNNAPGLPSGHADECWAGNTDVASWWQGENGGNGAWICYMSAVLDPKLHFYPTHWMPMPAPPVGGGK